MNSHTADREAAHRLASEIARLLACAHCGRVGSCVPAHFPRHRGMGAGHAGWTRDEWVPLCGEPGRCHDLVDGRNGIGAAEGYRAWIRARDTVSAVTGRPGRRRIGVTLQEATENLRVFADSGWSALEASEAIRAGIRRLTSGSGAEGVEGSVGMDTFDTNCEAVASDKED